MGKNRVSDSFDVMNGDVVVDIVETKGIAQGAFRFDKSQGFGQQNYVSYSEFVSAVKKILKKNGNATVSLGGYGLMSKFLLEFIPSDVPREQLERNLGHVIFEVKLRVQRNTIDDIINTIL